MCKILQKVELAPLTSFKVGGPAESYLKLTSARNFHKFAKNDAEINWVLGSGTNVLISDRGLEGLTLHFSAGQIDYKHRDCLLIADAGAVWDDLVSFSIKHKLWGVEMMSGIPGTVGGAVAININAYGQTLSDVIEWVEVYDPRKKLFEKIGFQNDRWGYKKSPFDSSESVILRTALRLGEKSTTELKYVSALSYAQKSGLDIKDLDARRKIILGTRSEAGSLIDETESGRAKTCGSFFKNPIVKSNQIKRLLAHDETAFSEKDLLAMNKLQDNENGRVSAAHILLAAGFKRGQTFGKVRLHPNHVLKIENYADATAQEIFEVAKLIQITVKIKLGIDLDFEVKTLGFFENKQKDLTSIGL